MGTSLNHYLLDTNIHIFYFAGVILPSQLRQQNHTRIKVSNYPPVERSPDPFGTKTPHMNFPITAVHPFFKKI